MIFKSLLFSGSLVFLFTSSVERPVRYLTEKELCPNLGSLGEIKNLHSAKFYSRSDKKYYVTVLDSKNVKRKLPVEFLNSALNISESAEKDKFLKNYKDICGGFPSFYFKIASHRYAKMSGIQKSRNSLTAGLSVPDISSKKDRRGKILDRLQSLQGKITQMQKEVFSVIGKPLRISGKDLVIHGSSIPAASRLGTPGIVHNGFILLKNYRKSDFASPDLELSHIQADDLVFEGTIETRTEGIGNFTAHIFRHISPNQKVKIASVRQEIRETLAVLEGGSHKNF